MPARRKHLRGIRVQGLEALWLERAPLEKHGVQGVEWKGWWRGKGGARGGRGGHY